MDPSDTWDFGIKKWISFPSCLLCASSIIERWIDGDGPSLEEMRDEQAWWNACDDSTKEHLLVPSAEVEKTVFHKQPQLWKGLYRGSEYFPEKIGLSI